MADTVTANFGWVKPEISGSPTTWGVKLNADLDGIDAKVFSLSSVIQGTRAIVLNTTPGPAANVIYGQAAAVSRWLLYLGDGEAETGGNAGSNFLIQACDASGTPSNALEIIRSSGQVIASHSLSIGGQAYKPGGGSWVDSSDARIKTVERRYEPGLDEITKLEPVVYHFDANDAEPGKPSRKQGVKGKPFVGLVAQDAEKVFPGMVTRRTGYVDGKKVEDLRDLDASELVYALVNAVKTLKARVEELEATK